MMVKTIEKVSAFITRQTEDGQQLLLMKHPHAGIQIPAGTVEAGETTEQAVLREVFEETDLTISAPLAYLGCQQTRLPSNQAIILPPATVFARPDKNSFDWIQIRSAVQVKVLQTLPDFTQITYIEYDQVPAPNFITMQIMGWVSNEYLAKNRLRHFYYLKFEGATKPNWEVFSDHHTLTIFWAPLKNLPVIISPQDTWLKYLYQYLQKEN